MSSFSINFKLKRGATPIILALLLISTFLLLVIFGPGIGDRLGFLGRQKEAEQVSRAETIPNDPEYPRQWALPKIRAPQAWDITTGSRAVKVAIVSTGIGSNTDVDPNLVPGYIALDPARNPCNCTLDGDGEGTQVAGVVGAVGNNSHLITGVAWEVSLVPVKACRSRIDCYRSDVSEGIRWAADAGAGVIHVSALYAEGDTQLEAAVNYARDRGAIVVAPAGNTPTIVAFPAAYPAVVAVGFTDQSDVINRFSGRGPQLDLVAPGVDIITTWPVGSATTMGGPGAAHVSGVLALLLSVGVSPTNAVQAIYDSAVDLGAPGRDDTYGWGRLDACGALNTAGFTCPVAGASPQPSPSLLPSPIASPSPTPVASPSPSPTTLSVVLSGRVLSTQPFSSISVSGTAPLNGVDLQGDVSGTATGNIRYRFDCTNDGTFERDTTTILDPFAVADLCNYSTAGSYTARVTVDRGGRQATDTLPITVTSAPSPAPSPTPSPTSSPVAGLTISGTVSSSASGVVSGARVDVSLMPFGTFVGTVFTNAAGYYTRGGLLPYRVYRLVFSASGYQSQTVYVSLSTTSVTRNVTLTRL